MHTELADQVQTGNVDVLPLEVIRDVHNLWLSPVAVIPQVRRRLRLIFYFAWSGLNKSKNIYPPWR